MRIATLCGSLHSGSTNAVVLSTISNRLSAATAGGAHAVEQLSRTLTWQGAFVVATCGLAAPLTMVCDDLITDDDALSRLHQVGDTLAAVLRGDEDVATASASALMPLGIDPSDRLS